MTDSKQISESEAVTRFVAWLYEHGPDPSSMPREKLLRQYWIHRSAEKWSERSRRDHPHLVPLDTRPIQYPALGDEPA